MTNIPNSWNHNPVSTGASEFSGNSLHANIARNQIGSFACPNVCVKAIVLPGNGPGFEQKNMKDPAAKISRQHPRSLYGFTGQHSVSNSRDSTRYPIITRSYLFMYNRGSTMAGFRDFPASPQRSDPTKIIEVLSFKGLETPQLNVLVNCKEYN